MSNLFILQVSNFVILGCFSKTLKFNRRKIAKTWSSQRAIHGKFNFKMRNNSFSKELG